MGFESRTHPAGEAIYWIEHVLVHSEGDQFGEPFLLTGSQKTFIGRAYEKRPDGWRRHHTVVKGLPKGGGKTELAAAVALEQLAGPTAPAAPVIPVAAASWDQANLVYGAARTMAANSPDLSRSLEIFDKQILVRGGPGRLFRVAAVAGTNDGLRPTFVVGDELHEWVGKKARVWQILTQGLAKRRGAWALGISTAGHNLETLCGEMYTYGKGVLDGTYANDGFLFEWSEPSREYDLTDLDEREAAVREVYGDLLGFAHLDAILAEFDKRPEYEWRRYFLNQWTATAEQWLPTGMWQAQAHRDAPADGTEVVLGFDGSYSQDSTALYGCTVEDPAVFVVKVWERPPTSRDWVVPRAEVNTAVASAMERWKVAELAPDPWGWERDIEEWEEQWGTDVVVRFPQTSRRMAEACTRFYTAVVRNELPHDHDPTLARHLENAVVKPYGDAVRITKERAGSERRIDAAVAAVMAHDRATFRREVEPEPVFQYITV